MPEAELNRADFHTPTWAKLRQHYLDRLESLRRRNDGKLNAEDTALLRGQIAECKHFLALETAPENTGRGNSLIPT